tara:strand:+ start:263 stop:436 length:174 start_codon:yes stop_codon:yes gene_type:complete
MNIHEIARKYVFGNHDALTDNQEIKDMVKDIGDLIDSEKTKSYNEGVRDGVKLAEPF